MPCLHATGWLMRMPFSPLTSCSMQLLACALHPDLPFAKPAYTLHIYCSEGNAATAQLPRGMHLACVTP